MRYSTLLVALLVAGTARGQDAAELDLDHRVPAVFATPHTAWASPYAQGKTRALFFLRGHGAGPREVVELAQRFDLEAEMVFWTRVIDSTQEHWHGGERGVQRMASLLAQPWDVFVFLSPEAAAVTPDMLPVEQQYRLLEAVAGGVGLVLIGADDPRVLKPKNQLADLPAALADVDGAAAFTVKQGRGARLPKRGPVEFRRGWEVDYDEWAMRAGKAVLWAAGKAPRLDLALRPKGPELARAALPGPGATLQWRGAPPGAAADVTLRRDDGEVLLATRQPLKEPEGALEVHVPRVRAGRYWIDVVAREGGRVAGFTSAALAVTGPRKVEAVALEQDWAEPGQSLSGKVRLAGESRGGERLIVGLFDRRGRELVRQTAKADAAEAAFRFEVRPWFPMLVEVRATLLDAEEEVASAWQFARVVKRRRGQFNFVMWDTPQGALAPWAEEALARSGVTVHLRGGNPEPWVAAYDVAWIPYTTHVGAACKPACWNDEAAIQAHVDAVVEKHVPSRRHGVFAYSLGDEVAVRGSCAGLHCLAAYHKYLAEQYGDVAALNASWGTSYAGFDEVQLSQPDDNDEAESLRAGNLPRWFDRQAFQSWSFCKLCERFGAAFRRIDPEGRCGFEGAGTFGRADDLDGFVRSNTFWSPYPGTADEVLRSIAPRDFPRANWMGYTKDADTLLEKYWRMVTRGCDAVWWWRWDALGRFHGWLAPNLDPYPAVQEVLRDTQIVRDGLGDLLLASEMQTDGVGILYSLPSAYAARVQAGPSLGSYEANHAAFHGALRELGLNFRYFTDRQMRLGEVDLGKFKVVVLPMTQAMGAKEAEMLRAFVRDGGLLVADVRPAVYDGHVKALSPGQLDDVFGVRRTGLGEAVTRDGAIRVPSAGEKPETLELVKARIDPAVEPAGATAAGAAGQTPLMLGHRFGKGQAVLLNLPMSGYPALSAEGTPEAAAVLLRHVLGQAQVSPALGLADADGRRLRNVEVTRWVSGPVEIVSVFRHHGRPEAARLELPRPMHVYDLKARKRLGEQQTVDLAVTPHRAQFYALSAQPLGPVTLKAAPLAARGSVQRVTVVSALTEGRQAVKLRVRLPGGRAADWADAAVVADKRGVVVDVPVAYNDPKGEWSVEATDVYTGTAAVAQFRVE